MAAWPELRRRYGGRLLHRLLACADACHAGQPAGGNLLYRPQEWNPSLQLRQRHLLHAIHGMPWRTPLLRTFAAGQGENTTVRWAPLLSLAVPCYMPQTCPKGASGL
jgi:hypothetical protein